MRRDQVVILGAGRSVRGAAPSAMVGIDDGHRVIDWLLDAFRPLGECDTFFVGGYRADEVIERYPAMRMVFNRDWERTGPVHSLGLTPVATDRDVYVCYSDVVFRRDATTALREADDDVTIAVDSVWRARYDGRTQRDLDSAEKVALRDGRVARIGSAVPTDDASAEFAGVLRLRGHACAAAIDAIHSGELSATAGLPDLVTYLVEHDHAVGTVDLHGQWAELDAKQDLARFVLGTKAESLDRLRSMQHGAEIPPMVAFTWAEWQVRRDELVTRALTELSTENGPENAQGTLIVRSSALGEDSWLESRAGHHRSIANVAPVAAEVAAAVDDVFASYDGTDPANQVLVQPMLVDVTMSGVVMTRTHAAFAPYYVLNFDDSTRRTDTVTGGLDARTIVVHRNASLPGGAPPTLTDVLHAVQNIEKLVGHDSLDIEFAVTGDDRVHILQVRPIALAHAPAPVDDEQVAVAIARSRRFLEQRPHASLTLLGDGTCLSVMSDWNPAEIIGTKPKRLATSIYRYLVTDDVWAGQRAEYGYRDVRPCPLLVDVVGHPYVDVRASFNSFVPAALPDDLARRLVDAYLTRLRAHPELHDKVEFEVAFTCLTVDFDDSSARLADDGFSADDIAALRDALRAVTNSGIARLAGDHAQITRLASAIEDIRARGMAPLDEAYHQLELVRRAGTPVFSHLARGGFVATSMLRSFEQSGVLTHDDITAFLASVQTVLGRMRADAAAVTGGTLGWADFVDRYGHLRPGTYDITSPSYRDAPEVYLRPLVERGGDVPDTHADEVWSSSTRSAVAAALATMGLDTDVAGFMAFARAAIAGREESKFVFTRGLSAALDAIAAFGESRGLDRDEIAHVSIGDVLACRDALADDVSFLRARAAEGRAAFEVTQGVCLPGFITDARDLVAFEQRRAEPNFVTQSAVEAGVACVGLGPESDVDGRIVLIPNADPGFDWLLARPIAGLITMYGGANSHMAVRAAELGLPAAVGVGEVLYAELEPARVVRLDCASRTIAFVL